MDMFMSDTAAVTWNTHKPTTWDSYVASELLLLDMISVP